jgi:hypothetical protein
VYGEVYEVFRVAAAAADDAARAPPLGGVGVLIRWEVDLEGENTLHHL